MQSYYGNKGNNLIKLKKLGYNVPEFTLLGKGFFDEFLTDVGILEEAQLLEHRSGMIESKFELIRNAILYNPISKKIEFKIINSVKNLNFPISIRSSSSAEDGTIKSGAGIFFTSLNVEKNNVINETRKVLASLYEKKNIFLLPQQDFHPNSYFMGIVFQEMVEPIYSGVAFSSNPITGDNTTIIVEFNKGLCENVVNGLGNIETFNIRKDIDELEYTKFPFLYDVKNQIINLEKAVGFAVDMEWTVGKEGFYFLQYRPITSIKPKPIINEIKIFSMSELNEENYPYLSYLHGRYPSWRKKAKFFDFCEKSNIENNKWKFIIFNKELISKFSYKKLFFDFDSDIIIYHLNSNTNRRCYINEIKSNIQELIDNVDENSYCVSLRESIPNTLSAISTIKGDGEMVVEYFYGKTRNLNSGIITPTTYHLGINGEIIDTNITEQFIWEFDKKTADIFQTEKKELLKMDNGILQKIFKQTQIISNKFGKCTVEWWIWNEKLYASDISILNNSHNSINNKTISNGVYKGKIYNMPKIDEKMLDNINKSNTFSVNEHNLDFQKSEIYSYLDNTLNEWSKEGKIILYCDKPYLFLAPFLKYIGGFVFNSASMLCHLSLILRERNIPAISLDNQKIDFIDGDICELNASEGGIIK
ncbi:MAG: hypothetical protein K0R54_623 [Clostridiaceae bacterium]|jgi:phosphoenolpyruvate synthase/pyruvate phosphate dikinase|nr:hypothetical protein [Clostridiaceae bacterium]